jgi:hypothetical protein
MSPEFMSMIRESEIPYDQKPSTGKCLAIEHKLLPVDTKKYAYGEFSGSPSSNNRLEFPSYE